MEFHAKVLGPELRAPLKVEAEKLGPRDKENLLLMCSPQKWYWNRVGEDGSLEPRHVTVRAGWARARDLRETIGRKGDLLVRTKALRCADFVCHSLECLEKLSEQLEDVLEKRISKADGCVLATAACVLLRENVTASCLEVTGDQAGAMHKTLRPLKETLIAAVKEILFLAEDRLGVSLNGSLRDRARVLFGLAEKAAINEVAEAPTQAASEAPYAVDPAPLEAQPTVLLDNTEVRAELFERAKEALDMGLASFLMLFDVLNRAPHRKMPELIRASERILEARDSVDDPEKYFTLLAADEDDEAYIALLPQPVVVEEPWGVESDWPATKTVLPERASRPASPALPPLVVDRSQPSARRRMLDSREKKKRDSPAPRIGE